MPNKYWIGGSGNNWSTAANWSLSSGVVNPTTVPTTADDVYFDANSGTGTVTITASATAANIYFTNITTGSFAGTLDMAASLTVSNNFTLSPAVGFSVTGTGNLICTGNGGILTSNGKTFSGGLIIGHTGITWTTFLADNWTILGNISRQSTAFLLRGQTTTRTLSVGGSALFTTGLRIQDIVIKLNGTGNISGTITSNSGTARIEIDTPSGVITHNAALQLNQIVFKWIQGTFTSTTAAALELGSAGNVLENVGSISFSNLSFVAPGGGVSATILSNVNVTNNMISNANGYTVNGSFNVFVGGSILLGSSTPFIDGTATIVMNGSTSANIGAAGYNTTIRNNLTINKTLPATVSILSPTFTWGTANRTLNLNSTTNFATNSTTLSLVGTPLTILNASNSQFYNLTTSTTAQTINLN